MLQDFQLNHDPGERSLNQSVAFSCKVSYDLLMYKGVDAGHVDLIWRSRAMNRVKIFDVLLFCGRLNTKANLYYKHMATYATCPCFLFVSKDADHLFIGSPNSVWILTQLYITPTSCFQDLWTATISTHLGAFIWLEILLSILWKI